MKRSVNKLAILLCTGGLTAVLAAGPAPAAEASASSPPRVRIGELSGPMVDQFGTQQYWLEVTARDRDGVISEITVEWTNGDYHSVIFASRSCWLEPAMPGDPVTMSIPVSLPGPGRYLAQVHAESIPSCDAPGELQSGPSKQRRFAVTA